MKLVTKFDINDIVYLNRNHQVHRSVITKIGFMVINPEEVNVSYFLQSTWAEEEELFRDKEQALQACFKSIRESCG